MLLIDVFLPPLSFFLRGKIIQGIVCSILYVFLFVLSLTGFGLLITIPSYFGLVMWSAMSRYKSKNIKKMKEMEQRLSAQQIATQKD